MRISLISLILSVVVGSASMSLAKEIEQCVCVNPDDCPCLEQKMAERRAEILSRYDQLLGFAEVCITDPCPVKRVEVTILGHKFDAVRVELPGRRIDYIAVENDVGIRSITACEPDNYVEINPHKTCYDIVP